MILDLSTVEIFPARVVVQEGPRDVPLDYESVRGVDSVLADLNVHKSGEEYICHGAVQARISLECARCLAEFGSDVSATVEFIVRYQEKRAANPVDEYDYEDYVYFRGDELAADISNIVRQAIILSISLKPLCSETCLGLCPRCGANLNEQTCDCRSENIDERWEALRKISNSMNKEARG